MYKDWRKFMAIAVGIFYCGSFARDLALKTAYGGPMLSLMCSVKVGLSLFVFLPVSYLIAYLQDWGAWRKGWQDGLSYNVRDVGYIFLVVTFTAFGKHVKTEKCQTCSRMYTSLSLWYS